MFIEHRKDEISVLAHLKQGSMRVRVRDSVTSGRVIGLSGNSGNTTGPHLHYHLQNTPIIQDAEGIKCYFHGFTKLRDSKTEQMKEGSPIQGDIVYPKY